MIDMSLIVFLIMYFLGLTAVSFILYILGLTAASYGVAVVLAKSKLYFGWSIIPAYLLVSVGFLGLFKVVSYYPWLAGMAGEQNWLNLYALFVLVLLAPFCLTALAAIRVLSSYACWPR
jgi:hypothetical protein